MFRAEKRPPRMDADEIVRIGKYEFTLTSDNLEKKDVITIPNYPSEINTSGLNFDLDEHSNISLILPTPSDKNPEEILFLLFM